MNRNRQRLIEALVFFGQTVKYPSKMMIYKLLAEVDFRHFKATGVPVTHLQYEAWKRGPVPSELHREISAPKEDIVLPVDMASALSIEKVDCGTADDGSKKIMFLFHPKRKANLKVFSPRQQEILRQVVEIYKTATPTEASRASHEPGTPWAETVGRHRREGDIIDYLDFIEKSTPVSKEEAREMIDELRAFDKNYGE